MKFLAGVLAALIAGAVIGGAMVFGGFYNVAASEGHSAVSKWLLHTTMHSSVESRAREITVPSNLVTDARVERGARAYDQICAACHLKPDQETTVIRQGLTPIPPRLDQSGHWNAAEQFWIVRHGIKMTGMPAWGPSHSDEELWEIVAFLQRLPELSAHEYADLVTTDRDTADDGHDHDHGDMGAMGKDGHHDDSTETGPAQDDDHYSDGHTH